MQGLKHLFGYRVCATDEDIGKVEDFFVDDRAWMVRYMLVRTGGMLSGATAVIPAACLGQPNTTSRKIPVKFGKAELEGLAEAGVKPVAEEMRAMLKALYGKADDRRDRGFIRVGCPSTQGETPSSLRSVRELASYQIETRDGPCGICTDLLADVDEWSVPYLVINTKEWRPHGHVLAPTTWVGEISWRDMEIDVATSREKIQKAQRFDPASHQIHPQQRSLNKTA